MVVNHNIPALFTHLSMRRSDRGMQQAMQRLSSGIRINSARDDAAGLAIANKLNYQVGGLTRASQNATHGISLIQTAEGALHEVHNMLQRMRELSVQAANGTQTNDTKAMIQAEIEELTAEIHNISRNAEYNRMRILNGEANRVVDNMRVTGTIANPAMGQPGNNPAVAEGEPIPNPPVGQPGHVPAEATRNLVTTLFVSHTIQPGRLDYTVEEAGRGALATLEPDMLDTDTFPPNTAITVNGHTFRIGDRTWADVRAEMNGMLPVLGMSMYTGVGYPAGSTEGSFFLVTNLAGADQSITLTGDLDLFGMTVTTFTDTGRDARVTTTHTHPMSSIPGGGGGLVDINGSPIPGSSLGISANGNSVNFVGSRGEDIRMNLQVTFNERTGEFEFPNGDSIETLNAEPLQMSKEFRDFGPIMLQIGPGFNTAMEVQIPRLNAETLGLVQYVGGQRRQIIDVRPMEGSLERGAVVPIGAEAAMGILDRAIQTVSTVRSRLGAYQNRLEATVRNLDVAAENTEQSRSRIQDTDMARETTRFAQYNVMFQAAMSILGQANQRPQQIIQMLQ